MFSPDATDTAVVVNRAPPVQPSARRKPEPASSEADTPISTIPPLLPARRKPEPASPEEDTPLCTVPPLLPARLDVSEDVDEFQGNSSKFPAALLYFLFKKNLHKDDVDFFCRYTVHKLGKLMLFVKLFVTYHSLLLLLFIIYVLLEVLTFSFCVSSPDELQFDPTVSSGHFGQLGKRQRKTAG